MTTPLTWKERIERAKMRRHFIEEDVEMSVNWSTCAVGEHLPAIQASMRPRLEYPWDILDDHEDIFQQMGVDGERLSRLGKQFCRQVAGNCIQDAEETYREINQIEIPAIKE